MKTGIFYGTTTGATAEVADKIAKALDVDKEDIHNVAGTAPSVVGNYELIIMGSPTYGLGELQEDWYDFLEGIEAMDLKGKKVAVFGLGDEQMTDTFCNAIGIIYNKVKKTGATMIGNYNTFPYRFERSEAIPIEGALALGLMIDEVNHPDVTDVRIADWAKNLQ